MRVLLGAFGTRGDVQPMLALAQALVARGHSIEIAVPPNFIGLARGFGFDSIGVGLDYEEISRRMGRGSFREMSRLLPLVRGEIGAQLHSLEESAAEADVIVGSSVFAVGSILSERFRRPYVFFSFCPQLLPSAEHPSPLVTLQRLPRLANRLTWAVHELLWRRLLQKTLNQARASRGLAPVRRIWSSFVGKHPVIASDPALALAPADYPVRVSQIGAMFVREHAEISAEVRAFLEAGSPPVYVGFGSMADPDPRRTTERLLHSVRRARVRALVSRGWAGLGAESVQGDVLFIGPTPHERLFPRCAAVVHHGGAGTTHAAARAGVPQVVMPHILDQYYWAHQVSRAGIGPAPVARYSGHPDRLARAIRLCVDEPSLIERAREVAAAMRMDGAERGAELLERVANG
jgi:UDP:flavonoid glycosyltransferase YjiC (YdhE family)